MKLITLLLFFTLSMSTRAQMFGSNPAFFKMASVAASCSPGGGMIAGNCWYIGSSGQSCTTVCSTRGGYNDATRTYAGSSGSTANCAALFAAWGSPGSVTASGCASGNGCSYFAIGAIRVRCTNTTTEGASTGFTQRFCACNN